MKSCKICGFYFDDPFNPTLPYCDIDCWDEAIRRITRGNCIAGDKS